MSKEASDAKFLEDQLVPFKQYGEEIRYQAWSEMTASARSAEKKERDKLKKLEKRLIAITKYRVFIIKKSAFGGSRVLHKIIHLYDIVEISQAEKAGVIEIVYVDEKGSNCTARIKCDNLPLFLSSLRDLVRAISVGYPPECTLKFNSLPQDILPQSDYQIESGIAGGFLEVYNAQCSYYRTRPSLEFQRYVHYLVANGITDLDLTNCPGIDTKTDISIDIPTIFESLKHNTYFNGIILKNVQAKNITDSLGHALRYNTSISRVQINTQEDQSLVSLGSSLKLNLSNVLQVLDLSNNSLSMESVTSLCAGITGLTHGLPVLNLSHCGINAKGIHALFTAFESNFGVSLSIQELDLSYNKFDEIASAKCVSWFGHIKGAYALRKLGLAGTGADLVVLGPILRTIIDLHSLNLSNNKLDKPESVSELKTFIECTSQLNQLNLSNCSLSPESVEEILAQLSKNKRLHDLELNLSENNLGAKGATAFARGMADSGYLRSLNITHNKFKGRAIAEILLSLNTNHTIQELYIGKNLQGSADMDDLIKMLLDFVTNHPNLQVLDLSNSGSGKAIFTLLQALGTNSSITNLDISGNQIGDLGASILTDSLATNTALTSLNLDQNGLTLSGWQSLCFALATNRSLRQLVIPNGDLEKSVPNDRKDQLRELITRLTLYTQYNSGQPYPPTLPFSLPCTVPYNTPAGLTSLAPVPAHLRNLPAASQNDTNVLEVLNASTSPDFKKNQSPISSPEKADYKYVASPPRDNRSMSQPPALSQSSDSAYSSPSMSPYPSHSPTLYPSLSPPPPLSPPPSLSPPPPFASRPPPPPLAPPPSAPPMDRPTSNHSLPAHPTLAPPPRNNLFAPPAIDHSPPQTRAHAPSAPPAVQQRPPAPPPVPSPSRSGGGGGPPPPPPFGGPPPPPPPSAPPAPTKDRSAVLGDITSFSKKGLKKTVTNDRSSPKV